MKRFAVRAHNYLDALIREEVEHEKGLTPKGEVNINIKYSKKDDYIEFDTSFIQVIPN
jgi:hypothetical protein